MLLIGHSMNQVVLSRERGRSLRRWARILGAFSQGYGRVDVTNEKNSGKAEEIFGSILGEGQAAARRAMGGMA
jgi:hypothetical protein